MRSAHARPPSKAWRALLVLALCFAAGLLAGAWLSAWQFRGLVHELADGLQDAHQDLEAMRDGVCRSLPLTLLSGSAVGDSD